MASFMTHLDVDDGEGEGEDNLPTTSVNNKASSDDSDDDDDDDTTDEEEETLLPVPTAATTITAAVAPEEKDDSSSDDDDSDDDDDDDDDAAESAIPGGGKLASVAAANAAASIAASAADTEEENDNDDSESGDGDELPLATPYPWAHDDYELTLHHDPKKRKPVGTGIVYVKRLMLDSGSSNHEEATVLSNPAKNILKQLFAQSSRKVDDSSDEESDEEDDDEEEEDEEAVNQRRHLPGPRLWTEGQLSINDYGLFRSILQEVEKHHPANVSSRFMMREMIMKLPAGDMPGVMDAKEFVCCALHFLSSEWKSPDPRVLPSLPLINNTTAPGNARDLEKRTYEKASAWKLEELEKTLPQLERLFLESPAASDKLQYIGRVRFCPRRRHSAKNKSETSILLKGTMPARMMGKNKPSYAKSTSSEKGPGKIVKKRKPKTQGVNLQPQVQGKQLPYSTMGNQEDDD